MDLDPADYAQRLASEENRPKLLAAGNESVESSISLSYNLLDAETQKRWRLLGVFPDTFDALAAAAVWGMAVDPSRDREGAVNPADAAKDTLSRLLQYSMLEWNDTTKRYRLHDLMRDFARKQMSESERQEAARSHAEHYKNVLAFANTLYKKGHDSVLPGLALFDLEWANVQAGQAWAVAAMARAPGDLEAAGLCNSYPNAGVSCLALRLHSRERIGWLEAAASAARRLKDRSAEASHLGNLGNAYAALGETRRAIEFHEKDLAIEREIRHRLGEGIALGNLGLAYASLGETRRAVEFDEQAFAIHREIGDRRGEANALWNTSLVLEKLGERKQAIEHAEAALKIFEQIEAPTAAEVRRQLEEWKK